MKNSIALFLISIVCASFLITETNQLTQDKAPIVELADKTELNSSKELEDLMNNPVATTNTSEKFKNQLKTHVSKVVAKKADKDCDCKAKTDCFKARSCGWCFQNDRCVSGTKSGPTNPCKATSFYFDGPKNANWNPQAAATINISTGPAGKEKFIITDTPDLSKVFVDSAGGFRKSK